MRAQKARPSDHEVVKLVICTFSYSRVLHWHQMRMASIWGDMQILLLLPALGLMIPSSSATPAWVAIPPLLLFGFKQGDGFLVSSIKPAMFFRNRLCMFFSSISRSLIPDCCSCW